MAGLGGEVYLDDDGNEYLTDDEPSASPASPGQPSGSTETGPPVPEGTHQEPIFTRANLASVGSDLATGAVKRVGQYLHGAGKLIRDNAPIHGIVAPNAEESAMEDRISDSYLDPSNETQAAGALPADIAAGVAATAATGGIGGAGVLGAMTRGGLAAAAQDATLRGKVDAHTGVSGVIGAGGGALEKFIGRLADTEKGKALAEWLYRSSIGVPAKLSKVADKVIPQAVDRGLVGSAETLAGKAALGKVTSGKAVGKAIDDNFGKTIPTRDVLDQLDEAIQAEIQHGSAGQTSTQSQDYIESLKSVRDNVERLGPTIPVDQAVEQKRALQRAIKRGGGFSKDTPMDGSGIAAKNEGQSALRRVINENFPDIEAASNENAFWQGLDQIMTKAVQKNAGSAPIPTSLAALYRKTINRPEFMTRVGQGRIQLANLLKDGEWAKAEDLMRLLNKTAVAGEINRKKFEEDARRRKLEATMGLH